MRQVSLQAGGAGDGQVEVKVGGRGAGRMCLALEYTGWVRGIFIGFHGSGGVKRCILRTGQRSAAQGRRNVSEAVRRAANCDRLLYLQCKNGGNLHGMRAYLCINNPEAFAANSLAHGT